MTPPVECTLDVYGKPSFWQFQIFVCICKLQLFNFVNLENMQLDDIVFHINLNIKFEISVFLKFLKLFSDNILGWLSVLCSHSR